MPSGNAPTPGNTTFSEFKITFGSDEIVTVEPHFSSPR